MFFFFSFFSHVFPLSPPLFFFFSFFSLLLFFLFFFFVTLFFSFFPPSSFFFLAEEQHLDADVEVPAHKTWRVEDVVADVADAAPEQMNSLASSKTEVFEKIVESLRPLCMVGDLNDDEVMELCILSNELTACETTATLNPSKFVMGDAVGTP